MTRKNCSVTHINIGVGKYEKTPSQSKSEKSQNIQVWVASMTEVI